MASKSGMFVFLIACYGVLTVLNGLNSWSDIRIPLKRSSSTTVPRSGHLYIRGLL